MSHPNQTETTMTPSRRRKALLASALCFSAFIGASIYSASNTLPPIYNSDAALEAESASIPEWSSSSPNRNNRELSIALPHGGCQVTYAHLSETPIPPTWQASFPGSGARMTFMLVEALTGIRTTDDYDSHDRGYERVVAVKTHYPVKDARRRFKGLDEEYFGGKSGDGRAMVILRNPLNAIPSYFNLQYEHLHQLPNHSTRGPNEDWIKYRDHPDYGFKSQITNYEKFVTYWMEKYPKRSNLLMLSYEDLTDNFIGPIVATRIAAFLGEVEGVKPIAPESVGCVWETIVNYKNVAAAQAAVAAEERKERMLERTGRDNNSVVSGGVVEKKVAPPLPVASDGDFSVANLRKRKRAIRREANRASIANGQSRRALAIVEEQPPTGVNGEKLFAGRTHADPSSLRVGPKVRPYTEENLRDMLAMFERLVQKYNHDEDFVRIIASYIETAKNTPPNEGL